MGWRIKKEAWNSMHLYIPQHRYLLFYTSFENAYGNQIRFGSLQEARDWIDKRTDKARIEYLEYP